MKNLNEFFSFLQSEIEQEKLNKLTLSLKRDKKSELKSVFIKSINLRGQQQLSFVYRYPTTDTTKNYSIEESLKLIEELLKNDFLKADFLGVDGDVFLTIDKNELPKFKQKRAQRKVEKSGHQRSKKRLIEAGRSYLKALDITAADGRVKKNREDKFKQINKFVEIMSHVIQDLPSDMTIADMGCGKGYLTFALYDYVKNSLHKTPSVYGVELRPKLVEFCNQLAQEVKFEGLTFEAGRIGEWDKQSLDVLIALHACDTATDDAILQGIKSNAQLIVCAPCCHRQVRQAMCTDGALQEITRHGILLEREAEIITDSLRALYLEAAGYKTKIMEFISTEHTPKNLLIIAEKRKISFDKEAVFLKIEALKAQWGLQAHYLDGKIL